MINYFNLIRALKTDQYDELTVKELKEEFNTEPDIDTQNVEMFPEGYERFNTNIAEMAAYFGRHLSQGAVVVFGNPNSFPVMQKEIQPFPIKELRLEPIIKPYEFLEDPTKQRRQKRQNQLRSRNHKK